MSRYLRIYKECVIVAWNQAVAYRLNFILAMLITLFSNVLFPLFTVMIYRTGSSFPGWNMYEVLLLQSIFTMANGVAGIVTGGVLWSTLRHVVDGSLDTVLLKPVNTLFFMVASTLEPTNFGLVLGGGILYGISLSQLNGVTFASFGGSFVLFVAGVAVLAGISFLMSAISFRWVGNSRMPEIFESVKSFGKYPISIFPRAIQTFVTVCIPVAVVGYYPAKVLLGKGAVGVTRELLMVIPCLVFMVLCTFIYNWMVRLYEGVGG